MDPVNLPLVPVHATLPPTLAVLPLNMEFVKVPLALFQRTAPPRSPTLLSINLEPSRIPLAPPQ